MIPGRSLDRDIKLFISALCLQFRPLRVDSNIPECDDKKSAVPHVDQKYTLPVKIPHQ